MSNNLKINYNQKGYVMLFSVILLSVIGVAIASSLVLLGLAFSQSNFAALQSAQANNLAQACAETALDNLRQDPTYAGSGTLDIGAGSCDILPIQLSGSEYLIQAQGTVGAVVRKISVEAQWQAGPPAQMQLDSWQEVADF